MSEIDGAKYEPLLHRIDAATDSTMKSIVEFGSAMRALLDQSVRDGITDGAKALDVERSLSEFERMTGLFRELQQELREHLK